MIIYCRACGVNHRFTETEAERIIYILQAELSDEVVGSPISEAIEGTDEAKEAEAVGFFDCFKNTLNCGSDVEMYGEHIQLSREARIHNGRAGRLE